MNLREIIKIVFLALLIISEASAQDVPKENVSKNVIKIGYITDLSGKGAFWGKQSSLGAKLAEDEINKSGLRKVEVIFADSRTETKEAVTIAQRFIHLDKVDALVNEFTPTSIAVSPLAKQAKILYLYLAPAESILVSNPYAYKSFLDYKSGCRKISEIWKKQGITVVGDLKLNTEFGELCDQGAKEVFPKLLTTNYNSGDDLNSLLLNFKKNKVQAFFQTAYETDMISRLKILKDLNFNLPVAVPEPLLTELVVKEYSAELENTVVFGFPEVAKGFVEKVLEADPKNSLVNIEAVVLAYLHIKQLVKAISVCSKNNIECQMKNMNLSENDSSSGFRGWKNRIAQFDYQIKVWKDGKLN